MTSFEGLESRVLFSTDMVIQWNDVVIDVLRADRTLPGPTWSSRTLAMMHAAIFDAVNGIDGSYRSFLVTQRAPRAANMDAAIASAAHAVLLALYPQQQDMLDQALAGSLAQVRDGSGETRGVQWGQFAAQQMLLSRTNDGSEVEYDWLPDGEPGHWEADPLNPSQTALGPGWGNVDPFSLDSAEQFDVPSVPAMTSAEYAAAFEEVKSLGALDSTTRTAEQTEIGLFWAYDGAGLGTPPALYNQIVQTIAQQRHNTVMQLPGVTRTYSSFSQAAAENGRSRIYLGIHWSFDDLQGEALGRDIAGWVVDHVAQSARPRHATHSQFDQGGLFADAQITSSEELISDNLDENGAGDLI